MKIFACLLSFALFGLCISLVAGQDFGPPQVIDSSVTSAMLYATDLDGDGDADVLSASGSTIAWYENQGGGVFGSQRVITTSAGDARSVYATDLDGDGDADVLSASLDDDKIAWYENQGGGVFGGQQVITASANGAYSVYATDLDGDGDADVLSGSLYDDKLAWYENQGGGVFGGQQVITTSGGGPFSVYATDLDGDGDADVLSAADSGECSGGWGSLSWFENRLNQPEKDFSAAQSIDYQGCGPQSVSAADLDGDGDADALWGAGRTMGANPSTVGWSENVGAGNGLGGGTFGPAQVISAGRLDGRALGVATNLDGDFDLDVVLITSGFSGQDLSWCENQGGGSLGLPQQIDTIIKFRSLVATADLNGDGYPDLLVSSKSGTAWYVNLMTPDDCNGNGIPDDQDIANGTSADCNGNGVPDECDIANDPTIDANLNGVPDICEGPGRYWIPSPVTGNWYAITDQLDVTSAAQQAINWGGYLTAVGTSAENAWLANQFGDAANPVWIGLTDTVTEGTFEWINGEPFVWDAWLTGQPDDAPGPFGADFVILLSTAVWMDEPSVPPSWPLPRGVVELESSDCDGNGIPDTYEVLANPAVDCDGNGIHDACDLLNDPDLDCDSNGVLDVCDIKADPSLDCDKNGVLDICDLWNDPSLDCDGNDRLDECDISDDPTVDCDGNGTIDSCEWVDCDGNSVLDACDILGDPTLDWNGDGILDVCTPPNYCTANPNSTGLPAVMSVSGSPIITDNNFTLTASQMPTFEYGYFLMAETQGFIPNVGGSGGNLCLGFPFYRFNNTTNGTGAILSSGPTGTFSFAPNLTNLPQGVVFMIGETWDFQAWYRDGVASTSNFTDGIEVMFR